MGDRAERGNETTLILEKRNDAWIIVHNHTSMWKPRCSRAQRPLRLHPHRQRSPSVAQTFCGAA